MRQLPDHRPRREVDGTGAGETEERNSSCRSLCGWRPIHPHPTVAAGAHEAGEGEMLRPLPSMSKIQAVRARTRSTDAASLDPANVR